VTLSFGLRGRLLHSCFGEQALMHLSSLCGRSKMLDLKLWLPDTKFPLLDMPGGLTDSCDLFCRNS
jgi:hypothetical protein